MAHEPQHHRPPHSRPSARRPDRRSRPARASPASPGTTFFLSVVNTNMLGASVQTVVLGLALFYGGLAQLLAGMWEFAKGNTFGAVAFSSFGAFWLSFWYLLNHLPDDRRQAEGRPARRRAVPAGLDDLHRVHDDRGDPRVAARCSRCSCC